MEQIVTTRILVVTSSILKKILLLYLKEKLNVEQIYFETGLQTNINAGCWNFIKVLPLRKR